MGFELQFPMPEAEKTTLQLDLPTKEFMVSA